MVLTAENVNRILERYNQTSELESERPTKTHQRAMLNPQMDFISRHVAFDVPIHREYLTTPLLFRLFPRAVVKSMALDVAFEIWPRTVQLRYESGLPTTTDTTIRAIKKRASIPVLIRKGRMPSK